jgi:hypothetical protein
MMPRQVAQTQHGAATVDYKPRFSRRQTLNAAFPRQNPQGFPSLRIERHLGEDFVKCGGFSHAGQSAESRKSETGNAGKSIARTGPAAWSDDEIHKRGGRDAAT